MDAAAPAGMSTSAACAGFWRRFGAIFVDGIISAAIAAVLAFVVSRLTDTTFSASESVAGLVVSIVYFIVFWSQGQTLGCKALHIRLVKADSGSVPGYGTAIVRVLVYELLSSGSLLSEATGVQALSSLSILGLIGALWMIWDARKQTWWDKAAGTVVVEV